MDWGHLDVICRDLGLSLIQTLFGWWGPSQVLSLSEDIFHTLSALIIQESVPSPEDLAGVRYDKVSVVMMGRAIMQSQM